MTQTVCTSFLVVFSLVIQLANGIPNKTMAGHLEIKNGQLLLLEIPCAVVSNGRDFERSDNVLVDLLTHNRSFTHSDLIKQLNLVKSDRPINFSFVVHWTETDRIKLLPPQSVLIIVFDNSWGSITKLPNVIDGMTVAIVEGTSIRKILETSQDDLLFSSITSHLLGRGYKFKIITCVLLYICAITSILIGCYIVIIDKDKMLNNMEQRRMAVQKIPKITYLYFGLLIVMAVSCLIMLYYFYDIMVYFLMAIFSLCAFWSVTRVLSFFTKHWIPPTRKKLSFTCCKSKCLDKEISIASIIQSPVALSFVITWFVFRNNPEIGWPIQSMLGVFVIASFLSSTAMLPSLKLGTLLFSMFLVYDVFFVFISPLFVSKAPEPRPILDHTRNRRGDSFMEAVASGTAGKSGELVPLTFRININEYLPISFDHYELVPHGSLLGFGDALVPGLLSGFLALYDACWKIPGYRHFWSSIVGYTIGIIIAFVVMFCTGGGQPALLYLCPCSLLSVVLTALCFGGVTELKRLWIGILPSNPDETALVHTIQSPDSIPDKYVHNLPTNDEKPFSAA